MAELTLGIGALMLLFSTYANLIILQTEIIPFANEISKFEMPHDPSNFLGKKDLLKIQENLKKSGIEIQKELEKCGLELIIFGQCSKANSIFLEAKYDMLAFNEELFKFLKRLEGNLRNNYNSLIFLGLENTSPTYQETVIAINRLANPEETTALGDDLESQIMYLNYLSSALNKTPSMGAYIQVANIITNSFCENIEILNNKVLFEISAYKDELRLLKTDYTNLLIKIKQKYQELKYEDLSVINIPTPAFAFVQKENLATWIADIQNLEKNVIFDENHERKSWLQNSLDFYEKQNSKLSNNIEFYETCIQAMNTQLAQLESEFLNFDSKIRNQLIDYKKYLTKSDKIKCLRYNIEIAKELQKENKDFEKNKNDILLKIFQLKKLGVDVDFEEYQLKTAAFEQLIEIKNSLFKKEQNFSQEFNALKEEFLKKQKMLLDINVPINSDFSTISELKEAINSAELEIQKNSAKLVKISDKIFLTSKPICNSNTTYTKVSQIDNIAEQTVIFFEEKLSYFIKCEEKTRTIIADQDFKTVQSNIKITTMFDETLIYRNNRNLLIKPADLEEYSDFFRTKNTEIELFYKMPIRISVDSAEYQIENKTKRVIKVINLDEDFEIFNYKINFDGTINCSKCYLAGNQIIFEVKNFKKGELQRFEFEFSGTAREEHNSLKENDFLQFTENYSQALLEYQQQEKEKLMSTLACQYMNCSEERLLFECQNKILLDELKNISKQAQANKINFDEKELPVLENISLNETNNIVLYFTKIFEMKKTIESALENARQDASEKLVLAKAKFQKTENQNAIYDYLNAAVSDFQTGSYYTSAQNSEKIIAFEDKKEDYGWIIIAFCGITLISFGIFIFKKRKIQKPIQKKILKLFDEEI